MDEFMVLRSLAFGILFMTLDGLFEALHELIVFVVSDDRSPAYENPRAVHVALSSVRIRPLSGAVPIGLSSFAAEPDKLLKD